MKTLTVLIIFFLLSVCPFSNPLLAQSEKQDLTNGILLLDSLFWTAYNNCDIEKMQQYFTDDVEFYHDKGGLTLGVGNLVTSLRKNLCGNGGLKLRREAVKGSIKVFPLQGSDVIYGAIISGEHVFYVLEKGKEERLDGLAKFTNVWILSGNVWKMSRIFSYDHGPAPYVNHRKVVKLGDKILDQFAGQYLAPQSGVCKVQKETDLLHLIIGDQKYILYPQSDNIFFVKDRDLTFEFVKNQKGNISKMTVRENGNVVEEAVRKN
jgi:hypothetical protein